jgi:3-oxoadipate enol-lactonase
LINGLADDLETWVLQMEDFLGAGYRVLRIDNRGVGKSSAPPGPYTSRMLADDAKAVVDELGLTGFHLIGTSMGGMIAQEYAINHGADLASATFSSTYAAPGPFCSRMFSMWHDMATITGVPFIMRDVTLWAFTQPFFWEREDELKEFEMEMADLPMSVDAYLAQLNVIQAHDTTGRLDRIPVSLSKKLHEGLPKADWATSKGGHASMWEHPTEFNRTYLGWLGEHR